VSFGAAAARRAACPCGSGADVAGCCGPLLEGAPAPSAERLMRSRYTAFVRGDAAHLLRTWHPHTRPAEVRIDAATTWQALEIIDAGETGDTAQVEFRARYRDADGPGVLHERSRFARRGGRWMYVDGDVE
jgi:SEC-C motif domain protein